MDKYIIEPFNIVDSCKANMHFKINLRNPRILKWARVTNLFVMYIYYIMAQTSVAACLNVPLLLKGTLLKLKDILMPKTEVSREEEVGQCNSG